MFQSRLLAIALLILTSCNTDERGDEKAVAIVDACIAAHGGENYKEMDVAFDYRQFRMRLMQSQGKFSYERSFTDSTGKQVHDILTNEGFTREIEGKPFALTQKESDKFKEGLNAMAYFALLPYKLSDEAVRLAYLGDAVVENKKYDKIAVSFALEGGGKDHRDEFCYWIRKDSHTMDYLSYSNGGPRFRKAISQKNVGGVVFQDYYNYLILDSALATSDYDKAFLNGRDSLLSTIIQSNYTSASPHNGK